MKLKDYEFGAEAWPPPRDKQNQDTYLVGFDEDYQPYLLRWETAPGSHGWCACTLENNQVDARVTASPKYFEGRDVSRRIKYWADLPVRKSVINKHGQGKYDRYSSYCNSCGSKHH